MRAGMKMMLCWIAGYGFGVANISITMLEYAPVASPIGLITGAFLMFALVPVLLSDIRK